MSCAWFNMAETVATGDEINMLKEVPKDTIEEVYKKFLPTYYQEHPTAQKMYDKPIGPQKPKETKVTIKVQNPIGNKKKVKLNQLSLFTKVIGGRLRKKMPIQDKIKIMRLKNSLEKQRLVNALERLRLQKKVQNLRLSGKLPMPAYMKPRMPPRPVFSSPIINNDIDSMYADIGHADGNIFGEEDYYGGENYYPEDFYGTEFNTDPMTQLGIRPRSGVSPLLW